MPNAPAPLFPSFPSAIPFLNEFLPHAAPLERKKKGKSLSGTRRPHSVKSERSAGTRVLLLGRIRELALYRAEVLQAHGYAVSAPPTKEESLAAIRRGHFDVAILSYTLSSQTVEELAELIREYCPEARLIAISNSEKEDREINPEEIVLADDGPPALIAALRRVTRQC